jgi:hypothetical protein
LINLGSSCIYPKDVDTLLTEDMILGGRLESTNEGYAIAKIAAWLLLVTGAGLSLTALKEYSTPKSPAKASLVRYSVPNTRRVPRRNFAEFVQEQEDRAANERLELLGREFDQKKKAADRQSELEDSFRRLRNGQPQ